MTNEQRILIDGLRLQGLGYKKISAQLGISENTVKSYLRRIKKDGTIPAEETTEHHLCKCCGKPVEQHPGRKEKKFCSDTCRNRYWNSHLELVERKAIYHFTCPTCGKSFSAYGNAKRKYCSRACYLTDRFGGEA